MGAANAPVQAYSPAPSDVDCGDRARRTRGGACVRLPCRPRLRAGAPAPYETRLDGSLEVLAARVETLSVELADALERLEAERRLVLALGDLRPDAELPDLLGWVADAAADLSDADAAVACLVDGSEQPHLAARGIWDVPHQPPLLWPPEGPRAARLEFDHEQDGTHRIRRGLVVPIGPPASAQSSIAVFWHGPEPQRPGVLERSRRSPDASHRRSWMRPGRGDPRLYRPRTRSPVSPRGVPSTSCWHVRSRSPGACGLR